MNNQLNPDKWTYEKKFKGGVDMKWIPATRMEDLNRAIQNNFDDAAMAIESMHNGEMLQTAFAYYRAKPKKDNRECPYCGFVFGRMINQVHTTKCRNVPGSVELVQMMNEDEGLTLAGLAHKYSILRKFIALRFVGTTWTEKRLRDRGKLVAAEARRRTNGRKAREHEGVERCECGILMDAGEDACYLCRQEKEDGKTQYQMMRESA